MYGLPRQFAAVLSLLSFFCGISGEKLVVNVDAGGDDALALLLLLRYEAANKSSGFEVVGITCSFGNTEERSVVTNVLKTLTILGRDDIPVYSGATQGLNEPFFTDYFFGSDGFGDAEFNGKIIAKIDQSKHAAVALVDLVKKYSGKVSIVSLAPLTNIALAISLDTNFTNHVNHFYVMGASVAGHGNRSPNVEFNIGADPESAFILFNAAKTLQITLVPWETVLTTGVLKDWRQQLLGKYDSPYIEFLNKVEQKSLLLKSKYWISADAFSVACMIEPSLILKYQAKNVQVVTDGSARGSVMVDYHRKQAEKTENSKIVLKINKTNYESVLIKYLTCEEISC